MPSKTVQLVLVLAAPWVLSAADDTPTWLKDLAGITLPQYPAKVQRVVLLNEEHTVVSDAGKLVTTTRTATKILNQQGGNITYFEQYDSASGKVKDFRAWMLPPAGKVKKYGKEEIVDTACAENDVYNECRRRAVSGKRDAEAGAIFAYEATTEHQSFSNQLLFHFQESDPVKTARFIVTLPQGWELKSSSFNNAPAESAPVGSTYTWQMENLAAMEREPAAPGFLTLAPWVGVNLVGPGGKRMLASWPDAAKLLSEFNEGQYEPNDAILAKARSLTEAATTELEKIRAIGRFTQQLRYVSIQTNISKGGGYKPHAAAEVFQKLYGDCKDKANLTRAMLKAIGITAYPVAIYSGDRTHVGREWPTLGAFNHAITAIRVGPDTKAPAVLDHPKLGRLLFFDPTDPYVPVGYVPDHEQASLALIATAESGDLVRVPAGAVAAADHAREVEAVLGPDGSISGKFVDRRSGEELANAVSLYRGSSRTDYVKSVERWVGFSIPAANTSNVEATDGASEFVLKGQFASASFAQRPQPKMLLFRAALLSDGTLRLTEKTRKYPVELDPDVLHETVRIQLPPEFKVDELPPAIKLNSDFGSFQATWTAESGTLVFQRTLEMPAQSVPPARYADLKKFLNSVTGSAGSPIVLVH